MTSPWSSIIVAAGTGQRFSDEKPKQYAHLGGMSVLTRSIEAMLPHGDVLVVINPDHAHFYTPLLAPYGEKITTCTGGPSRQESVRRGLEALKNPTKFVMIHDAARPLVAQSAIEKLKQTVQDGAASATLASPVVDTLVRGDGTNIDRTGLWAIQTPQAFDYELLLKAHQSAGDKIYTDDTTLMRAMCDKACTMVESSPNNFKITLNADLARAEAIIASAHMRPQLGMGFDVHAFGPKNQSGTMRLCATDIPCDYTLIGHSDADAALHAVADAILGAIGQDDIGVHFPPSDEACKNMDSAIIVQKALQLMRNAGGMLGNVDITLMAQTPRLSAHRAEILANLSTLLGLPTSRIGLKATTTEKLGFVGRKEGLAVQAIATIFIGEKA